MGTVNKKNQNISDVSGESEEFETNEHFYDVIAVDRLFVQVKEVNIVSALCLTGVISQIFDKALMEPTFCEMYAKFCVQLVAEFPEFYKVNEKVIFKRELLNNCQEEFERDEMEQAEADRNAGDSDLKISGEEREEKKAAMHRRMLGDLPGFGQSWLLADCFEPWLVAIHDTFGRNCSFYMADLSFKVL
jgi:hypothetical protein